MTSIPTVGDSSNCFGLFRCAEQSGFTGDKICRRFFFRALEQNFRLHRITIFPLCVTLIHARWQCYHFGIFGILLAHPVKLIREGSPRLHRSLPFRHDPFLHGPCRNVPFRHGPFRHAF